MSELRGVGVSIVREHQRRLQTFLVRETNLGLATQKYPGMLSHPMETAKYGESRFGALDRLFQEEAKVTPKPTLGDWKPLNTLVYDPRTIVNNMTMFLDGHEIQTGDEPDVEAGRWMDLYELAAERMYTFSRKDADRLPPCLDPAVAAAYCRFLRELPEDEEVNVGPLKYRKGVVETARDTLDYYRDPKHYQLPVRNHLPSTPREVLMLMRG